VCAHDEFPFKMDSWKIWSMQARAWEAESGHVCFTGVTAEQHEGLHVGMGILGWAGLGGPCTRGKHHGSPAGWKMMHPEIHVWWRHRTALWRGKGARARGKSATGAWPSIGAYKSEVNGSQHRLWHSIIISGRASQLNRQQARSLDMTHH
jgi:hypothetical protein